MKKKYPNRLTFLSGIIILYEIFLLTFCTSNHLEEDIIKMGYAYFPLERGDYWVYEVVDIQYTIQNGKDSTFYYLKAIVKDSSINATGVISYYVNLYKRDGPLTSWNEEPVYVNTIKRTSTNLVEYEGNVPYVKLTFPVKSGLTWDGNAFNTTDPQYYYYTDGDLPDSFSEFDIDQIIRVVQNDFDDQIIRKDIRYEMYAAGIGLVYVEKNILEYCQEPGCFGEQIISSGKEYRQTLIEYGKE